MQTLALKVLRLQPNIKLTRKMKYDKGHRTNRQECRRQRHMLIDQLTDSKIYRQTYCQLDTQTDRQTDRGLNRQINRQRARQTCLYSFFPTQPNIMCRLIFTPPPHQHPNIASYHTTPSPYINYFSLPIPSTPHPLHLQHSYTIPFPT